MTDIIQTVAVVIALIFTGVEWRSKARELRFQNYLSAMSGFREAKSLLIQVPALHGIHQDSEEDIQDGYKELSDDQRTRVHFCDSILGLCETVWTATRNGWLDASEWEHWRAWLQVLMGNPEMRWTLQWVRGEYSPEFLDAITAVRPNNSFKPNPLRGSA